MKLVWSNTAKTQLKKIYHFYLEIAGEKVSKSIRNKLIEKPKSLIDYPELGQVEENPAVAGREFRYLVEGHHKIVYKAYDDQNVILIAAVFDTRQNPSSLKI